MVRGNEARAERADDHAVISVAGVDFVATPSGALWWPDEDVLIVADLHLEKGSSFARRGNLLPPYDTASTLGLLADLVLAYRPRGVLALGDSFHDTEAVIRLAPSAKAALAQMMQGREWVWLAGNHDPEPVEELGGQSLRCLTVGPLTFRHEPALGCCRGEIAGHLHPAARVRVRGRSIRRRCFVSDGARMVLPAFGAYAGGLNVLSSAFRPLFPSGEMDAVMLGDDRTYAVSATYLVND